MKLLKFPFCDALKNLTAPEDVNSMLNEKGEACVLAEINWLTHEYAPEVKITFAHDGEHLYIKYDVIEDHILGRVVEMNGPVHRDSCVEFFFSPRQDGFYYNFEFNAIGTVHVGYGKGREDRVHVAEAIVSLIETFPSLGRQPIDQEGIELSWNLLVKIPLIFFEQERLSSFSGLQALANFFKCGDETKKAHFLTWKPVRTEVPDFHQYKYLYPILFA